jgi:hypothetical protein
MSEPVEFEYDGIHALPLPRGGQLWVAPWPLCWTVYLVSGRGGFLGVTDPREQGSMVWHTRELGPDFKPIEWWQEYFAANGYRCEGQLRDVEFAKWDSILAKYERAGVRGPAQP